MTDRRRALPLIVLAVLVLLLAGTTLYFGRDEYQQLTRERGETIGTQTTLDEKVGPGRLRIGEDIRKASGIETAKLHGAESGGATALQGVVLDIRPLVDARGRYRTQSAEIRALRASAAALEQEYRRARELFADDPLVGRGDEALLGVAGARHLLEGDDALPLVLTGPAGDGQPVVGG